MTSEQETKDQIFGLFGFGLVFGSRLFCLALSTTLNPIKYCFYLIQVWLREQIGVMPVRGISSISAKERENLGIGPQVFLIGLGEKTLYLSLNKKWARGQQMEQYEKGIIMWTIC